jgi:uncharacterized protein with HEPN domain
MSRDKALIADILHASKLALGFCSNYSKSEFFDDQKTQSAVLHQLLIIGEAVKNLSVEFRATQQQIRWKLIAGMRNKVIHEYNDVDLDEVWSTIKTDIPHLIDQLHDIEVE